MVWCFIIALFVFVAMFLGFIAKIWQSTNDLGIRKRIVSGTIIIFIILICFTVWMIFLSFVGAFKNGGSFINIGSSAINEADYSEGFSFRDCDKDPKNHICTDCKGKSVQERENCPHNLYRRINNNN